MASKKRGPGHLEKFFKRADKAIDDAVEKGIKKADFILDDAVKFGKVATKEAKKKSIQLRKQAKIESKKLKKESEKKIGESISAAKKITTAKGKDLETLAKLGELRKSGIITEKEFRTKKKEILKRI